MNLKDIYDKLSAKIDTLDFNKIWAGFKPIRFALYNETECFFAGEYIEKTVEFCANTAIEFSGEIIAIWNMQEEMDLDILASKMVHEMFHGFQEIQEWNCFPREMEALCRYQYNENNLSIKLHENRLLLEIADCFDHAKYDEVLACRKYRKEHFPYEFGYEVSGEEIEGCANYIEWMVLKQINPKKADELIAEMKKVMIKPDYFFPIRITSYYTGALMINAAIQAGDYEYGPKKRPFGLQLVDRAKREIDDCSVTELLDEGMVTAISNFEKSTKDIITKAVAKDEVVVMGPCKLKSVNIYDAKYMDSYITSRFFVMYADDEGDKIVRGDFVVKMNEKGMIEKIYRAEL